MPRALKSIFLDGNKQLNGGKSSRRGFLGVWSHELLCFNTPASSIICCGWLVTADRGREVLKDLGSPEHGDDERRFHVGAPAEPVSEEPRGLLPANLFKNKNQILEKTMSSDANTDERFCGEASDRTKTLWMSHVTETNYSITEQKTCLHLTSL